MKAVGYQTAHPIDHPESLLDITLPDPVAAGRDLLVEVHAVSVNPVDTKVRKSSSPSGDGPDYKVLGWDASGIVRAVGPDVTLFQPGDRVWYAGSIARQGTNSELHLLIRPCEVLSRVANVTILEVANNALRVLLQHRHVIIGSLA